MGEKLVPALTYIVQNACECGGAFKYDAPRSTLEAMAADKGFKHICDLCNKVSNFDRVYPYIIHKEISA
ncbi:hypothetical protein AQUSIP_12580 [Aquicella siphonis]|uniref:Uncharacterized protein n=1 Tax=Aquicella siphonis TaxID=254247 RepID=A0A5E4PHN2_9COXI|nr:hypothetical protein AQUSIP_12580 [Aquicella siphonis]